MERFSVDRVYHEDLAALLTNGSSQSLAFRLVFTDNTIAH